MGPVEEWWTTYGSAVWRRGDPAATLARLVGLLIAGFCVGGPLVTALTGAGAGIPAPYDDPDKVEWLGLLVDALYGIAVITIATFALVAGRRLLPTGGDRTPQAVRAGAGHAVLVGLLALLAIGAAAAAVAAWPNPLALALSGFVALQFAAATFRAAREPVEPARPPTPPPASFAEPVKLPSEPPVPHVVHARVAAPRPFVVPPGPADRRDEPDRPD